jgi:two-component system NtrC family sensor kinase
VNVSQPAVLIVDDSLTVRMDLAEAFTDGGFEVVACAGVAEARAALDKRAVAAAVLDVRLPDGDGVELLQELRARPDYADRPVLMLSSEAEVTDRVRALRIGADEYVGKPYDSGYVVARTRELLSVGDHDPPRATTVLLVDDSLTLRMELADAMRAAGYTVITAENGEEGLRQAADRRPDALVVDRDLPGIDGPTVIRRIRLDAALRDLPCLLLTAATEHGVEAQALEAGADAFVRKDEERDVMLAKLAAMLRSATPVGSDRARSPHGPKRVLVVDDSPTYLDHVGECLRAEGYEVVHAHTGEEALDLLATQPVDCILLDLRLPGISGRETCRQIKQTQGLRDVPLIIVTTVDDPDTMLGGLADGADDYIRKSDQLDVLTARVRAQIRRKHSQDENRRIRDELLRGELEAAQARALGELVDELEWKNRELEAFNYSVSHDLRNPLHIILAFGADILDEYGAGLDPQVRRHVERIHGAAQRMNDMVGALLRLSHAGRAPVSHERVDLAAMAHEIVADLRAHDPGRTVDVTIDADLVAHADPGLIRVVLENLIGNAWKYSSRTDAPRIEVRAGADCFLVRDNGAGFSMEHADTIFDPYGRLHTDSEFPGTGIGLATVHRIIDRHGGRIWAEGAVGQGATFRFTTTP